MMTIDDAIRWLEIQDELIKEDLPTMDEKYKEAQLRAYAVNKMCLKGLQKYKELLKDAKEADDYMSVGIIRKTINEIEQESNLLDGMVYGQENNAN